MVMLHQIQNKKWGKKHMKLVTIEDLKDGDIIANDVLLEDYTVVLGKGTVIKEQYIDKLRELSIFTVYIEEKTQDAPKEEKKAPQRVKAPAAKPKAQEKKPEEKKPDNRRPKLSLETVTVLRDDVEEDANKKNKSDFVLWFTKSKFDAQELKWDSPWGVGYPGWHIECSCISMKHLGEYMDIHCGGVDNIFPHHTNEIAQSEAYVGHKWCNYWFHVHHLNDKSGKMSKSKGDFLTVSLLEKKNYNPLVYRFFCLQSHYRKPLEFSFEVLDNMSAAYDKLVKKIGTRRE